LSGGIENRKSGTMQLLRGNKNGRPREVARTMGIKRMTGITGTTRRIIRINRGRTKENTRGEHIQ